VAGAVAYVVVVGADAYVMVVVAGAAAYCVWYWVVTGAAAYWTGAVAYWTGAVAYWTGAEYVTVGCTVGCAWTKYVGVALTTRWTG